MQAEGYFVEGEMSVKKSKYKQKCSCCKLYQSGNKFKKSEICEDCKGGKKK